MSDFRGYKSLEYNYILIIVYSYSIVRTLITYVECTYNHTQTALNCSNLYILIQRH